MPSIPSRCAILAVLVATACAGDDGTSPVDQPTGLVVNFEALGPVRILVSADWPTLIDGRARRVTTIEAPGADWLSPDGASTVGRDLVDFASCLTDPPGGCWDVVLTDLSPRTSRTIASLPLNVEGEPTFTADGSAVVFGWFQSWESGLMRVGRAGGSPNVTVVRWVPSSLGELDCPRYFGGGPVSGDATGRIAFACGAEGVWIAGPDRDQVAPLVTASPGGPPRQSAVYAPAFSPSGDRVAYLRTDDITWSNTPMATVRVMSIPRNGGTPVEHGRLAAIPWDPTAVLCWMPGAERILVAMTQPDYSRRLRSLTLATGAWADIVTIPNGGLPLSCVP
jgi:hypothetical protein